MSRTNETRYSYKRNVKKNLLLEEKGKIDEYQNNKYQELVQYEKEALK